MDSSMTQSSARQTVISPALKVVVVLSLFSFAFLHSQLEVLKYIQPTYHEFNGRSDITTDPYEINYASHFAKKIDPLDNAPEAMDDNVNDEIDNGHTSDTDVQKIYLDGSPALGSDEEGDKIDLNRDGAKSTNWTNLDEILEIKKYRERRGENFDSWFGEDQKVIPNIDDDGNILDFSIVGFAKCGTTSMEANLGTVAPMPIGDVCTPLPQTVYYAYKNWPQEYNSINNVFNETKILRGTKCPKQINDVRDYSKYLPKTLLIVGIRHPVMFYQSFWNMMADNTFNSTRHFTPYDFMEHCYDRQPNCINECPRTSLLCMHKSRFHIQLAKLGKTSLNDTERELLAPDDKDGGTKLKNNNIRNKIFLYEISQLNDDNTWDELAKLLKIPQIPHGIVEGKDDKRKKRASENRINICDAKFDDFRARIMPHAYNMSKWICDYFAPVAKDETRDDLFIPNHDIFCNIVRSYANDPCNRLVRDDDGNYKLGEMIENSTLVG